MPREVWKVVKIKAGKIRVAKTKRRREGAKKGERKKNKEKTKKREDNRSKEGGRGVRDFG